MATCGQNFQKRSLTARPAVSVASALLSAVMFSTPAVAQTAKQFSIFENITLSPDFTPDPTTVRGISGGARPAAEIAGRADTATGPCVGFVDDQPDHTMQLTQFFNYLSLQVQSPEDTTLVIRGPGGSWCNDDYQSANPGIAGQWLSGTYQIWIGSYERDRYMPYVIRITDQR
ncbi:MAG: hypothetical protein F6K28_44510 [Microcoleus sp. SIO2G3]|nr:hypothetical protein [Microcoleus sp. SIO2G3]